MSHKYKYNIDITGQKFGKITAKRFVEKIKSDFLWECACECGKVGVWPSELLIKGNTTSCGCSRKKINRSHGKSKTKIYSVWSGMKRRCYVEKARRYNRYGGRGIKVCDEWLNSFEQFFLDMGDLPFAGAQIDRIDNDGDYSKENCRWVTTKENCRNTSINRRITIDGKTMTLTEWAEFSGIDRRILSYRIKRNYDIDKILSPVLGVGKYIRTKELRLKTSQRTGVGGRFVPLAEMRASK